MMVQRNAPTFLHHRVSQKKNRCVVWLAFFCIVSFLSSPPPSSLPRFLSTGINNQREPLRDVTWNYCKFVQKMCWFFVGGDFMLNYSSVYIKLICVNVLCVHLFGVSGLSMEVRLIWAETHTAESPPPPPPKMEPRPLLFSFFPLPQFMLVEIWQFRKKKKKQERDKKKQKRKTRSYKSIF